MLPSLERPTIGGLAIAAVAILAGPGCLLASAFAIGEQGARAAGMGTAFTAVADDGAAIFYNPARIAVQTGMHTQMDAMAGVGLFRFFPSDPLLGTGAPEKGFHGFIKPKFIPVGSMYLTRHIKPNLTFGFGLFAPFGPAANFTNFNDGDPIARLLPEGRSRLAGTSNRPGFNRAYHCRNERRKTNFGFNWRSAVTNHLKGKASFAFGKNYTLERFVEEDLLFNAFPNQDIKGSFTTPRSMLWESPTAPWVKR